MRKENGRVKPAEQKEIAGIFDKNYICPNCDYEFSMNGIEFGEVVRCPKCDGEAQEKN